MEFYRLAEETVEARMRKQLLERETWYKNLEEERPRKHIKREEGLWAPRMIGWRKKKHQTSTNEDIKSVICVPHMVGSGLAKKLREKEER